MTMLRATADRSMVPAELGIAGLIALASPPDVLRYPAKRRRGRNDRPEGWLAGHEAVGGPLPGRAIHGRGQLEDPPHLQPCGGGRIRRRAGRRVRRCAG